MAEISGKREEKVEREGERVREREREIGSDRQTETERRGVGWEGEGN